MLHLFSVVLVALLFPVGAGLGIWLALRCYANNRGACGAVLICSPMSLLAAAIAAHLLGGWGEELLGTGVSVALGIGIGSVVGSATINLLDAGFGTVCHLVMRRCCNEGEQHP